MTVQTQPAADQIRVYITNNGVIIAAEDNSILFATEHSAITDYDYKYRVTRLPQGQNLGEFTSDILQLHEVVQIRPAEGTGLTERIDKVSIMCQVVTLTSKQFYDTMQSYQAANMQYEIQANAVRQGFQPDIASIEQKLTAVQKKLHDTRIKVALKVAKIPKPRLEDYLPK